MINLCSKRRGGEAVTRESAKLLCRGSIPLRASYMSVERGGTPEHKDVVSNLSKFLGTIAEKSYGAFKAILSSILGT